MTTQPKTWTYYEVRTRDRLHFETLYLNHAQGFVKERFEATGEIAEIFAVDRAAGKDT